MNLLKRWRKNGNGNVIVRRADETRETPPLARWRDLREQIDRAFDRVWRDFDRVWRDFERDPWSALARLPEPMGLTGMTVWNWPAVDVGEDDKAVTIRVDVPGLDEKDLDIELSGNLLTIRGSREDEWSESRWGVRRRERVSGSFVRTISLPSYVDADKIQARYDKGTLTITVPKLPGQGPRRVPITSG
jgi:HSP20 family protein